MLLLICLYGKVIKLLLFHINKIAYIFVPRINRNVDYGKYYISTASTCAHFANSGSVKSAEQISSAWFFTSSEAGSHGWLGAVMALSSQSAGRKQS